MGSQNSLCSSTEAKPLDNHKLVSTYILIILNINEETFSHLFCIPKPPSALSHCLFTEYMDAEDPFGFS